VAGTIANTYIGQGRPPTGGELAVGGAAGALGGLVGARVLGPLFPTNGMTTIRSTQYFGPRTWSGLISGKPNVSAIYKAGLTGGIVDLGLNVFGGEVAPGPNGGK
jgi:hypothetical protein